MSESRNDYVRFNGEVHHFQLHEGLDWLLIRFPDHAQAKELQDKVASLPPIDQTHQHAQDAMKLLYGCAKKLDPQTYANIYCVIDHARQLTQASK